jgi:hypothetical protein
MTEDREPIQLTREVCEQAITHRVDRTPYGSDPNCQRCKVAGGAGPSHNGSAGCRSGSIAAGGNRAHCSCDTCY